MEKPVGVLVGCVLRIGVVERWRALVPPVVLVGEFLHEELAHPEDYWHETNYYPHPFVPLLTEMLRFEALGLEVKVFRLIIVFVSNVLCEVGFRCLSSRREVRESR